MATWHDPSAGYNTFSGSVTDLMTKRTKWGNALTATNTQKAAIAAAWTADASTALQANVQAFADTLPGIRSTLLNAHTALEDYKDALDSIRKAQTHWVTQYDNANWQLNQPDRNVFVDPVGAANDAADRVVNLARFHEARYQLDVLYGRRSNADNTLIAALATAMPATWADTSAGFASNGITQSMLLSSSQSKEAMLDLAQRMIDGNMSQENINALSGLLSVWGNSQTTMSQFFSSLGGSNSARLIDMLGEEVSMAAGAYGMLGDGDQAILTLADRLQSGLSVGSQNWGQDFANGFVDDMFNGDPEYWARRELDSGVDPSSYSAKAQAIAFLFSDPATSPMSETLTVAVAEMVDVLEREGGLQTLVNYTPQDAGIGAGVFGLYEDGVYTGELSQMDLPGRVFETMGLYPDSALEFLTADDERIDYWFGERDWSASDGFAGPGGLWLGAATVAGPESAGVASSIMAALSGNPSFLSEYLSDRGAANLAGAISIDLPGMVEYATTAGSEGASEGPQTITLFGESSKTDTPGVSMSVLADILGVVGATDPGAIILNETATNYQTAYIAYGLSDPAAFTEALRQSNALQGVIDGAGIGETIASADRSDTRREEMIAAVSMLVGAIPIPGVSGLAVEGGVVILDFAQNLLIGAGENALFGLMGGSEYSAALLSAGVSETTLAEAREFANGTALYSYLQTPDASALVGPLGIDTPPTREQYATDAAFIADANDWYQDNRPELDAAAKIALDNQYFELDIVLQPYTAQAGDAEGEQLKP